MYQDEIQGQLRRRFRPQAEPMEAPAPAPQTAPRMAPTGAPVQSPDFAQPQAPATPQRQSFDVNAFRQGWTGSGGRTVADLEGYINSQGWSPFVELQGTNRDKVHLKGGGFLADAVRDSAKGGTGSQWLDADWYAKNYPQGGSAQQGAQPQASQFQQQIRDLLMQQLAANSAQVTADDPAIKGQMDAQGVLAERMRAERRAASAERAAAEGLNSGGAGSGAFDAEVASGYEDKGQRLSGVLGELMGREVQAKRDKVAQLLAMAMQSGDSEAARTLQLQLANMDNELRRLGIREQARQFDDSFGLDAGRFQYGKDRDSFLFGAGGF